MLPVAPGLFSTKNDWPRRSPKGGAMSRAMTSTGPPGPNGTKSFTGRSGHAALAERTDPMNGATTADRRIARRVVP